MDPTPVPEQTPEGRRLQRARKRRDWSLQTAADRAGISNSWWRNVENGFEMKREQYIPVNNTPPDTLAKMARAVGVTPDELREDGRDDAARELEALMAEDAARVSREAPASTAEIIARIEAHPLWPDYIKRMVIAVASTAEEEILKRAEEETEHDVGQNGFDRRQAM